MFRFSSLLTYVIELIVICSLIADISARPFYEAIWVTDFIMKFLNLRDLSRPLSDRDRLKVVTS